MKHLNEDDLILLHYRENQSRNADAHLRDCATCRANLQELSRVLNAVQPPQLPDRSQLYGAEVWNRLRATLPERQPRWHQQMAVWWRQPRAWAAASAVAVLVVASFLAGHYWKTDTTTPIAGTPPPGATEKVRDRVLLVAVGGHLERSQMVLVELANTPDADGVDISQEQRRAQELLSANRLYRQTATEAKDANVAAVLDQLERLLIDIAHRPAKLNKADVESLRRQIESQGLVFKIRVVESNVRNELRKKSPEPRTPAAPPSRQTT